jgi:hypothetical protein
MVNRPLLSIFLIVPGIVISLVAIDVIQLDPETVHAPNWIIGLLGLLFLGGGLATVVNPHNSLASWSAGTAVISLTIVSAWVALYGPSEQFSGDFPFLSRETNVTIARIVFGCVTLLGLAITAAAARNTWRRPGS